MKSMKIAVALLALVLVTSCIVGSTFAKYTSSANMSGDTATVAKWAFELNDKSITASETFSFDLFAALKEADGTTAETNVSATDGSLIAPGTGGSFEIKLENLSQVDATYEIAYTVTNTSTIPVKFSVDNGVTWKDTLDNVGATDISHTNGTAEIIVQWKWAFDGDDTALGVAAANATEQTPAPTITVSAVVTATQKD